MSTPKTEDDLKYLQKKIKYSTISAIVIAIAIFSSYIGYLGIYKDLQLSSDSGIWGTFGDFIGGLLNPIIAGLAFYWLTESVLIHKKELSETQNVLKETEKTQKKQRFENSFFSLLEQMNAVYIQLNTPDMRPNSRSKNVFNFSEPNRSKLETLHQEVFINNFQIYGINSNLKKMRENSADTNHYFRIIYQLLKFILTNASIDKQNIELNKKNHPETPTFEELLKRNITNDEKFYSNIVRSFLSKEVTKLLAVNCIDVNKTSEHLKDENNPKYQDYKKFRSLIERYAILEHLTEINDINGLENYYKKEAFGSNKEITTLYNK
ncbi:putative phage abortive infection protein [Photobacterium iliopiscarium]|uniref:Phage abortive infection protein n=1 Tax=Photobacterium iliopiscarium TaxID=56192 RepID=A0A2T3MIZ6_9GAMM|nr:putative phage abortive infection protein [Photobacterium iliopiscarium]PSV95202.1 hypothetical protein C9I88_13470 [Photobacterium iliopiscarium]